MSFNEIIGQQLAVDLVGRASAEGRQAHAYLFAGPEGVGKSLLAKVFAKALNCAGSGERPCDECASCKKIEAKNHPDAIWLTYRISKTRKPAEGDSGDGWLRPNSFDPRKKSEQINIEQIRYVQKALSLKPFESKVKVCIIDGADQMTEEAANCLLKVLEEPPGEAVFILLASNMFRLLPTIISRCQKVPFYPLQEKIIAQEMIKRFGFDDKRAMCVARFSEGRLGIAIKILEEEAFAKRDKVVEEFISPKQIGYEDIWLYGQSRQSVNDVLNTLAIYFRDLLVFTLSKDLKLLVNLDKAEDIKLHAMRYSVKRLQEIIETIAATQDRIKRNANIKIALSCLRLNITS